MNFSNTQSNCTTLLLKNYYFYADFESLKYINCLCMPKSKSSKMNLLWSWKQQQTWGWVNNDRTISKLKWHNDTRNLSSLSTNVCYYRSNPFLSILCTACLCPEVLMWVSCKSWTAYLLRFWFKAHRLSVTLTWKHILAQKESAVLTFIHGLCSVLLLQSVSSRQVCQSLPGWVKVKLG